MKGLTRNTAYKLIDDIYGYVDDGEWIDEMVDALTEETLDNMMEPLVVEWKSWRKNKYRAQAKGLLSYFEAHKQTKG